MPLPLSLRLAVRESFSSSLGMVGATLLLGIAVASSVYAVSARMETAALGQARSFLAADLTYVGAERPPQHWISLAEQHGLQHALVAEFMTMLYIDDEASILVAAKAVNADYPLRGSLSSTAQWHDQNQQLMGDGDARPQQGEIWLEQSLMRNLKLQPGTSLGLADVDLLMTRVIVQEPDRAGSMGAFIPRVMFAMQDVEATGAIRPGSRVRWQLMLAGDPESLKVFQSQIVEKEKAGYSVVSIHSREGASGDALRNMLVVIEFSGFMVLILALIAGILAGKRYFDAQQTRIAFIKTLGISRLRLLALYAAILLWLSAFVIAIGLSIGWTVQNLFGSYVGSEFGIQTEVPSVHIYLYAVVASLGGAAAFLLPALFGAISTPPMHLLRQSHRAAGIYRLMIIPVACMMLLAFLVTDLQVGALLLAILMGLLGLAFLLAQLLAHCSRLPVGRFLAMLALAQASWRRRKASNMLQFFALSMLVLPAVTLYGFREVFFDSWQQLQDEQVPNYFLTNLSADEREPLHTALVGIGATVEAFQPLIRARWSGVVKKDGTAISLNTRSSANISWSESLPKGNQLHAGEWWGHSNQPEVSLEVDYAHDLGVELGDDLILQLPERQVTLKVTSLREVNWLSLTPNFRALVQPEFFDQEPAGWMTSLYIPEESEAALERIKRHYPVVNFFSGKALLHEAQVLSSRLLTVVNVLLAFLAVAASFVLWVTLETDLNERRRLSSLMRVFGAPSSLLVGALMLELNLVGWVSGLTASFAAFMVLQFSGLEGVQIGFSWVLWVLPSLLVPLALTVLAVPVFLRTLHTPPDQVLRSHADF